MQSVQIQRFNFDNQDIAAHIDKNGDPWFLAKDVCAILEITNRSDALARLDEDEKGVATTDTLGGPQIVGTVNESGLYSLIMTSRKPEAKRFKKWVTSEVLPAIRKTGGYSVFQNFAIPKTLSSALRLAAEQAEQIEAQTIQLEKQKPAVEFVERYTIADSGSKGFREVCKILKANENQFKGWLIENKIMYRLAGVLTAHQNHIDADRFEIVAGEANGHAYNRCKFTTKGIVWVAGEWAKHCLPKE